MKESIKIIFKQHSPKVFQRYFKKGTNKCGIKEYRTK